MTNAVAALVALDALAWGYVLLATAAVTSELAAALTPIIAVVATVSEGLPLYLESKRSSRLALCIAFCSLVLCPAFFFFELSPL